MAALALTNETRGHYNYLYARVPARGSTHVCSRPRASARCLTCLTCLTEVSLYRQRVWWRARCDLCWGRGRAVPGTERIFYSSSWPWSRRRHAQHSKKILIIPFCQWFSIYQLGIPIANDSKKWKYSIVLVEKYFIKKFFVLLKISCILRKNICYEVVVCPVPECSDPRQLCWLRRLSPDCPRPPGSDSGAAVHCTLILNTLYTLYLCWTPCTAARQSCTQLSTAAATPPPPPPNPSSSV